MSDSNQCFELRVKIFTDEPTVIIRAFDDAGWDSAGRVKLNVEVRQGGKVIFPRSQLYCALHGPSDGNAAKELVMSLVSMKPGDTDPDFFDDYTEEQIAWVNRYGDYISIEREIRYCDESGDVRK